MFLSNSLMALFDIINLTNKWLGENIQLEVLIALPTVLLAVFIPLAIFMIDSKDIGFTWDKTVILKKVFNSKLLFISLLLYLLVIIFWDISFLRILFIPPVAFGIYNLLIAIINSYRWLIVTEAPTTYQESYRTEKRLEFLKTLEDNQKEIVWPLTWNEDTKARSLIDNRRLINVFVENVNSLLGRQTSSTYIIENFISNIEQINLHVPEIHEALIGLSLHWSNGLNPMVDTNGNHRRIGWTMRRLYQAILERDIKDSFKVYLLFSDSKKFIRDNNLDEASFVGNFVNMLLASLQDIGDVSHVWDDFPEEWKITFDNLEDREVQSIAFSCLTAYMQWITKRELLMDQNGYKLDHLADEVTKKLLPKIDPQIWSDMMAFHWSSYGREENESSEHGQIRGFVERTKTFGLWGRTYGFWEVKDDQGIEERFVNQRDAEIEETIKIATKTTIFPNFTNKSSFLALLSEINNFPEYEEGSAEDKKLRDLKRVFKLIKESN